MLDDRLKEERADHAAWLYRGTEFLLGGDVGNARRSVDIISVSSDRVAEAAFGMKRDVE